MNFKHLFSATFLTLLLLGQPSLAQAQLTAPWRDQNPDCVYGEGADQVATIQGIECLLGNIFGIIITLIGIVILVMIVFGAFKILTSSGDPKAVEAGKGIITAAVIGLIVALSSFFIINLIANFTGAESIKTFDTQLQPVTP